MESSERGRNENPVEERTSRTASVGKQNQERFWRRRLDGIGVDAEIKEFLAISFKRKQDVRSNYVEKATAAAQEQYKSLLEREGE